MTHEFLGYTYTFNGSVYLIHDEQGNYITYSHTETGAWNAIRYHKSDKAQSRISVGEQALRDLRAQYGIE